MKIEKYSLNYETTKLRKYESKAETTAETTAKTNETKAVNQTRKVHVYDW